MDHPFGEQDDTQDGPDDLENEQLARKASEGDHEAFATLYRRLFAKIRARLSRHTDAETAQDVTQEAFISGYVHIHTLKDHTKVEGWLQVIAKHKLLDDRKKHKKLETVSLEEQLSADSIWNLRIEAELGTPDNGLELREIMERAICSITQDQKLIIKLYFIDKLTLQEIAERLGKTEGAISMALHRAFAKMRPVIQREMEDEL